MWRCREWGTMGAGVDYLGHGVLTDVVGLMWVVSYIRICRVMYQTIGKTFPMR